jgi:YidC/Oxa1 family membrane protein insertase
LVQIWEAWWHLQLNILVAINSVVHNPGIAIIFFTLLVRLLSSPLTIKSMRSAKHMQQIQPKIREVQQKYAKDRQKQQEETMKLYQQYGVNPAASCFPMLLQLPIFIGLYSALDFTLRTGTNADALKPILWIDSWVPWANFAQPFLWIQNLAVADPIYLLPILSGVTQFIQTKMMTPLRDPNQPLDPQTRMMNNMMQFMPIYIVLISLGFPAGTVLYWTMSNVFGAVQQYFFTGFGSLPNVPGFHWLPRRMMTAPEPLPEPDPNRPVKKGFMSQMMERAVEAQKAQQEAQRAAQGTAEQPREGSSTVREGMRNGVEVPSARAKKKGSEKPKIVRAETMKYASDMKNRNGSKSDGNGREGEEIPSMAPSTLPRKRRGKR